jgi:hypothetical protein
MRESAGSVGGFYSSGEASADTLDHFVSTFERRLVQLARRGTRTEQQGLEEIEALCRGLVSTMPAGGGSEPLSCDSKAESHCEVSA